MSLSQASKPPRERANSRKAILDAAVALVAEVGAAHLTLEAVAQRAGISKGGLLYNFPTKLALLQAMIESYVEGFLALATAENGKAQGGASRALHELIQSRLGVSSKEPPSKRPHGVLAAMVEHPELLDPIRVLHRTLWARLKDTRRDHEIVLLGWLAFEGLLMFEMFKTSPFSAAERARLVRLATRLIDGELTLTEGSGTQASEPARIARKKKEDISAH
jgi:AcrR family transcriptional regulator